jgi:cytochrome c oxidase assembly protein subunit 11
MAENVQQQNAKLVKILVFVVVGMFGFGYALVPLYNVLCDITGIGGKTNQTAVKEVVFPIDNKREITMEFVTTVNENTPLLFYVQDKSIKIHPGEYKTVNFYAENKTDNKIVVRAIDSVSPGATKDYLEKTVCFCFSQQTFEPHERKVMPVRFVVKPDLPVKYKTITLSYTFFDNTEQSVKK